MGDFTMEVNLEEFKKMAKEMYDNLPTLNLEELENARKCLSLAWIGLREERGEVDRVLADSVYWWAETKAQERELELLGL